MHAPPPVSFSEVQEHALFTHFDFDLSHSRGAFLAPPSPSFSMHSNDSSYAPTLSFSEWSDDDDEHNNERNITRHSSPIVPPSHNTEWTKSGVHSYEGDMLDTNKHSSHKELDSFSNMLGESSHTSYRANLEYQILDYDESIWSKLQAIYSENDSDLSGDEDEEGTGSESGSSREEVGNRAEREVPESPAYTVILDDYQRYVDVVEVLDYDESCWSRLQLAYPETDSEDDDGTDSDSESADFYPSATHSITPTKSQYVSGEERVILDYDESCWAELQATYRDESEDDGDDEDDEEEDSEQEEEND